MNETGFQNLDAYILAFQLANDIFEITKSFPKSEIYSLTDQIRRSSRSVCANFAEGYRKRKYTAQFVYKLTECDAEYSETKVWISFSKECNYITSEQYEKLIKQCDRVGKILGTMIQNPEKFNS